MVATTGGGPIPIEVAEKILAAQAFNDQVGARITRFEPGAAVLEVEIADRHRQQFGVVHGGVLAYLVDNTLTFACGTVLGGSILTTGMSVSYLAAAREGVLRATATVTGNTGRHAVATVIVDEVALDGTARTCAVGQGAAVATARESRT